MHYVVLIVLAIISQVIVAWAGSLLHSIGTEEISYAVFTFSDDRDKPMSTNILINVCFPNVILFFVEVFCKEYKYTNISDNLIMYVVAFYTIRYLLICWILRRKELYNYAYELIIACIGIGIAYFLIHYFFTSQETLIITPYELREELWFIIIIILYKFTKLVTDKYVLQNTVLKKSQINQYIIKKFNLFYKRYNSLLSVSWENRFLCIYTYAVMIFEDYNRGPITRKIENLICSIKHKEKTLGIMQVKSTIPLSDNESVVKFYNELSQSTDEKLLDGNPWDQAWKYNNDDAYADSVSYIFSVLSEYIDEVPKYRKEFCIRQMKDNKDNSFEKRAEMLGKLLREGVLTLEEFEEEKRKLINVCFNNIK